MATSGAHMKSTKGGQMSWGHKACRLPHCTALGKVKNLPVPFLALLEVSITLAEGREQEGRHLVVTLLPTPKCLPVAQVFSNKLLKSLLTGQNNFCPSLSPASQCIQLCRDGDGQYPRYWDKTKHTPCNSKGQPTQRESFLLAELASSWPRWRILNVLQSLQKPLPV